MLKDHLLQKRMRYCADSGTSQRAVTSGQITGHGHGFRLPEKLTQDQVLMQRLHTRNNQRGSEDDDGGDDDGEHVCLANVFLSS